MVGDVDAVDGDVGHFAVGEALDEFVDLDGGHAGSGLDDVAEAEVLDALGGLGAVGDADDFAGDADAFFGFVAAEHAALAAGAEDDDGLAVLAELGGLGGGAGHVEGGEGELLGHVGGDLGVDAAFEEDGLALDVDLVHVGAYFEDFVDAQGGEGEGDEGGDAVALLEVDFAFQGVADFLDLAEEHAARAGATIAVLALELDVEEHFLLDLFHDLVLGGAGAGLLFGVVVDVGEGGGVDVEGLDVDEDFVVPDFVHVVVELVGGLREDAFGFDDAVGAVLVAFFLHNVVLFY